MGVSLSTVLISADVIKVQHCAGVFVFVTLLVCAIYSTARGVDGDGCEELHLNSFTTSHNITFATLNVGLQAVNWSRQLIRLSL